MKHRCRSARRMLLLRAVRIIRSGFRGPNLVEVAKRFADWRAKNPDAIIIDGEELRDCHNYYSATSPRSETHFR